MANWTNNKCGNDKCGYQAPGALPIVHCDVCGRDLCPKCHGGNPNSPMCKDCAMKRLGLKGKGGRFPMPTP